MISSSTLLLTATLLVGLLTAPETGIGANAPRADVVAKTHDEVVDWLLGYLAIDTSNPPGNESAAAAYLSAILHAEGIPTRLLVTPKGRVNLYARLSAENPVGGPLVLLHHMDVVPPGDGWTRRPFAAEIDQGRIWGRGAIDAKSLGICHLAALVTLQRERAKLKRDVIFLAVADEETGGAEGTQWLWKEHADLLEDAAFVLNEGGSNRVAGDRLFWWGIEVAQKRPLWLRVTTQGRGGHGSTYNPASATHQLVFSLSKLFETAPKMRVSAAAKDYFGALARFHGNAFEQVFGAGDLATVEREFQRMREDGRLNEVLMPGMAAFFQDTIQITSLATPTSSINVVPQQAEALVDVRLLPDTPVEDVLKQMRDIMGRNPSIEVLLSSPPTPPSSTATELYEVLERTLGTEAPLVPSFITGTTDSRYFRERGIPAYGFSPFVLAGDEVRGIHGADESIPLERFKSGLLIMKKVVRASVAGVTAAVSVSLLVAIYATVLGLITGSYLNVVIHRLPRGVSTVLPPSSCPSCGIKIRARDNVPLLSFLWLRGRCRNCGRSIGWRYPMVEAANGALFLVCYLRFGPTWSALVAALFGGAMIALALIDLEHFILPDRITLPGIAIGLLVQPLVGWVGLTWALVGAAVGAGVIAAMNGIWLAIRGVQGFGWGDAKMLAMIGAFLGLSGVVVTLFLAALLGSLTGVTLMARSRIHLQSKLPFGFFLSIGAIAALFYGRGVVDWYLSFFP